MRTLCLFAFSVLLTACASLEKAVQRPEVVIAGVEIGKVSMTGAELLFNLQVRNPNSFPLTLSGIEYGLKANGRDVFNGHNQQRLQVPAEGAGQIQLPVSFDYLQAFESLSQAFREQRISYALTGAADVGLFRVPFARTGAFDLNLQ